MFRSYIINQGGRIYNKAVKSSQRNHTVMFLLEIFFGWVNYNLVLRKLRMWFSKLYNTDQHQKFSRRVNISNLIETVTCFDSWECDRYMEKANVWFRYLINMKEISSSEIGLQNRPANFFVYFSETPFFSNHFFSKCYFVLLSGLLRY